MLITRIFNICPHFGTFLLNLKGECYERSILSTQNFCLWPSGGSRLGAVQEWFKNSGVGSSRELIYQAQMTILVMLITHIFNIWPHFGTFLLNLIGDCYERAIQSKQSFCLWPSGGSKLGTVQEWFKNSGIGGSRELICQAQMTTLIMLITRIFYIWPHFGIFLLNLIGECYERVT